jgi:uncharacterized protein YuzE
MNSPLYIKLCDKPFHKNIDVNDRGSVILDIAKDGDIIGVEILNRGYKIRTNDGIEITSDEYEQNRD